MSSPTEQYAQSIADAIERIQRCTDEAINKPLLPASVVQVLDSNEFQRDRKLTAGQTGNYLMHGGIHCPDCLSHQITGGQFDVSEGRCWQDITCTMCGLEWTDEYQLVSISRVSFAGKSRKGGKTTGETKSDS